MFLSTFTATDERTESARPELRNKENSKIWKALMETQWESFTERGGMNKLQIYRRLNVESDATQTRTCETRMDYLL